MHHIPTLQSSPPPPRQSPGMVLERAITAALDAGAEIRVRRGRVIIVDGGSAPDDVLRVLRLRERDIVDATTNPRGRGPVRCWRCRYAQLCEGVCRYD